LSVWKFLVVTWYIFPHFGILHQEKSGKPDRERKKAVWNNCYNFFCSSPP
jgi:hypothetical protein